MRTQARSGFWDQELVSEFFAMLDSGGRWLEDRVI
jgi:hypothetical protein